MLSQKQRDVRAVVVGSGIGGAAATLLLAHAGVPVTLLEKNRRVGGSCSGYEKQGFQIDIGTHLFSRGPKGPLGDVLRRVGEDGAVDFRRTYDIAELRLWGRDLDGVQRLKQVPIPADAWRGPAFAYRLVRALDLSLREAANAARLFGYILSMSDAEARAWDRRSIAELCERFTDDPKTLGLFGFLLGLYFILPYGEVSAGEAVFCFRRMIRDNWLSYPIGGSRAIPETYCRLARSRGAQIRVGVGARRILVDKGLVRGVETTDGQVLEASIVVSTSSLRTTVQRLVGAERFPASYVDRAVAIRGSYIAVQAKIALSKKLVSAGALVGGVAADGGRPYADTEELRAAMDSLREGRIPRVIPFYCPVPSNFDPSLAPPGQQLLTVCAVAPTTDIALKDPGGAWEEAMLRAMRRVVPGLDEHALFVDTFSVPFIERWVGKETGPAVSTGQTPHQVGDLRPQVVTPIEGLYVAGCGAGGRGVGTELAAASAMECVDAILADEGRVPPPAWRQPSSLRGGLASRLLARSISWATAP